MTPMSEQPRTATLEAEVPQRLLGEMEALVAAGWFRSLDEIVVDALRRFVDSHRGELMDELIREDVEWGLRGTD
jgi:Arc/MetJ-type ribon-helix-helix transcriptional regulator